MKIFLTFLVAWVGTSAMAAEINSGCPLHLSTTNLSMFTSRRNGPGVGEVIVSNSTTVAIDRLDVSITGIGFKPLANDCLESLPAGKSCKITVEYVVSQYPDSSMGSLDLSIEGRAKCSVRLRGWAPCVGRHCGH